MLMNATKIALIAAVSIAAVSSTNVWAAEAGLSAMQLMEVAVEVNPQVKSARARWDKAAR